MAKKEMNKGNESEVETAIVLTQNENLEQLESFNETELAKKLEGCEKSISLRNDYLEMEINEVKRGLFMGKTTANFESDSGLNEEKPAIKFFIPNEGMKIASNAVLINATKGLAELTPLEIKYLGKEKLSGGRAYKNYEVTLLKSK